MFSYRHAFHAGNHADLLKHLVLVQVLRHLAQKPAPFWVVDTHAGAGIYSLESEWAAKRSEFDTGIGRIWDRQDAPPTIADYRSVIAAFNPQGKLRAYPGSPFIALHLMRENDRLRLFELHANESLALAGNLGALGKQATRRTIIDAADGFVGLQALLPPPPRRGLILIDPSYEDKRDYARVVSALRAAISRFATGCYAIWYPQVQRREPAEMIRKLSRMPGLRWLHASLTVCAPSADGLGLHGSGMFIVNPPWTLQASMRECLPWLCDLLGRDRAAGWSLQHQGD
ncbi:MAG: 23S rRNA (adenine(2030)-N(6))-methyltransferase RlmJ [Quisquiliibacterium sp.]